jgi:DNA-binding transcriptional MerR regulator
LTEAALAIPKRALFKPAEVCAIASVQPYVLRSWETEFPDLGLKKDGSNRLYRRADVERVLRIKQLVFVDGLTLAGVRRRIEEEAPAPAGSSADAPIEELLGRNARERLADVRKGLRAILEMLSPGRTMVSRVSRPRLVDAPVSKVSKAAAASSPRRSRTARPPLRKKRR